MEKIKELRPTNEEVAKYRELYNADEIGQGDNAIDMEQARYLLENSDEWYYKNRPEKIKR